MQRVHQFVIFIEQKFQIKSFAGNLLCKYPWLVEIIPMLKPEQMSIKMRIRGRKNLPYSTFRAGACIYPPHVGLRLWLTPQTAIPKLRVPKEIYPNLKMSGNAQFLTANWLSFQHDFAILYLPCDKPAHAEKTSHLDVFRWGKHTTPAVEPTKN